MSKNKKLVIVIYSHPEYYPPTLNAMSCLSSIFEKITVLARPYTSDNSITNKNIKLVLSGRPINVRDFEKSGIFNKLRCFLKFTIDFYRILINEKPKWLLVYDGMPLLSLRIVFFFKKINCKVWYHNHDVYEESLLKKYSLSWFAFKAEERVFSHIDLFTLPAVERKKHFKLTNFKGEYFTIPNYPMYDGSNLSLKQRGEEIKLIFQGSIGTGHGLEEIIGILNKKINNKTIILILKGVISNEFKKKLLDLGKIYQVEDQIQFIGLTSYEKVKEITRSADIGIAIFTKQNLMNRTLGTASNKIYEYAASGLPILYFNNEHFDSYLERYDWAMGGDNGKESILNRITEIDINYSTLSLSARSSFENKLNFQTVFENVTNHLIKNI